MVEREYFDIDLKDQSKKRLRSVAALQEFDGIIHDRYESKYFSGKQSWRNPLLLRVSLPEGLRWQYISHTIAMGCGIWLDRPNMVGVPDLARSHLYIPLRGKHNDCCLRRSYRFAKPEWIRDIHPTHGDRYFKDVGIAKRVLDGELDLLAGIDRHV